MKIESIGYYESDIHTSRNVDSVYAMKYASQQMQIDKLQNNWNELKKWLEEEYEHCDKIGNPAIGYAMGQIRRIKDKMQEIESGNKDED